MLTYSCLALNSFLFTLVTSFPLFTIKRLIIPFGFVSHVVYLSFPKMSVMSAFPRIQTPWHVLRKEASPLSPSLLSPSVYLSFSTSANPSLYLHLLFRLSKFFNLPCLSVSFLGPIPSSLSIHIVFFFCLVFFYSFHCPRFCLALFFPFNFLRSLHSELIFSSSSSTSFNFVSFSFIS